VNGRAILLFVPVAVVTGCGQSTLPSRGAPVDVTGTVTANGKAVGNVVLQFSPLEQRASQKQFELPADGKFKGDMYPGKYSYYFTPLERDNPAREKAFDAIPEAYRNPSNDRTVDVGEGGGPLAITVN
jgi:hypothetical protein